MGVSSLCTTYTLCCTLHRMPKTLAALKIVVLFALRTMHHLKRLVRSGRSPLAQIVKRLSEMDGQKLETARPTTILRTQKPDNVFALSDLECCEVVSLLPEEERRPKMLLCRVYGHLEPCFMEPCDSRLIGVYKAQTGRTKMKKVPEELLIRKAFMVESDGNLIFLTVLHSF